MPTVSIFAGSKTPTDPAIIDAAKTLGHKLAIAGYDIVYGGGTQGVMGAVAGAAISAGGKVTAVVLEQYKHETQFEKADIITVDTEQDRFKVLVSHNNPVAGFTLPGSAGSIREAMQGLELAVYENGAPVILVQVGTYLDGLKEVFDQSVTAGLTRPEKQDKLKLWPVSGDLSDVLPPSAPPSGGGAKPKKTP